MDRQRAIENLESTFEQRTVLSGETMKMAVAALQEQIEREKGCKWCKGLKHGGNAYGDTLKELEIRADITSGYFCPICGRRLVE